MTFKSYFIHFQTMCEFTTQISGLKEQGCLKKIKALKIIVPNNSLLKINIEVKHKCQIDTFEFKIGIRLTVDHGRMHESAFEQKKYSKIFANFILTLSKLQQDSIAIA